MEIGQWITDIHLDNRLNHLVGKIVGYNKPGKYNTESVYLFPIFSIGLINKSYASMQLINLNTEEFKPFDPGPKTEKLKREMIRLSFGNKNE
jgi:hypothetical protein